MSRIRERLIFVAVLCTPMGATFAAEYQQLENIAAESAEEAPVGLEDIDKAPEYPVRTLLREKFAHAAPFWRDSAVGLRLRGYDLDRENGLVDIAGALAAGTELTFRSGKWRDRWSTVLSWHTSYGIDAPEELGRTGLLAPDQSNLSVISRAYLQVDLGGKKSLRLYRQDFNMPYINRKDSRMIPNTNEAYMIRYPGERLQWLGGLVSKIKLRDSEDFIPMGEAAGVEGNNSGTVVAGVRYSFVKKADLGALVQYTNDLFTTAYSEAIYRHTFNKNWGMQFAGQLTNQWSVGEALLGDFSTNTWGLRGKVSFRGAILTAAFTNTGSTEIRNPFGGTPGFTSSMLYDFDRANEEAYRVGLSLNLARINMPGISFSANYTEGLNAKANNGAPLPDADEIAITADFQPERGFLKGLWLRLRYAEGDRGPTVDDRREVRVILNYSLGALQ